jgi:hypothetical protein
MDAEDGPDTLYTYCDEKITKEEYDDIIIKEITKNDGKRIQ